MRRVFCGAAIATFAEAQAGDGIFGTKANPIPSTGSDSSIGAVPVIQMVLALLLVLALVKWVMPLFMKRFGKNWKTRGTDGIVIEETATVGPGSLHVVTVRGQTLLVGATQERYSLLANLSAKQRMELPTFQEMLEAEPTLAQFEASAGAETADGPLGDLAQQLERLRKLGM